LVFEPIVGVIITPLCNSESVGKGEVFAAISGVAGSGMDAELDGGNSIGASGNVF